MSSGEGLISTLRISPRSKRGFNCGLVISTEAKSALPAGGTVGVLGSLSGLPVMAAISRAKPSMLAQRA